jgi:hypothetical protein
VLSGHYYYDSAGLGLYTNFLYDIYKSGSFAHVMNKTWLLNRCLYSEENLELDSLTKLCAVYASHITIDKLNEMLLEEINQRGVKSDSVIAVHTHLEEILRQLVAMAEEKPIYSY